MLNPFEKFLVDGTPSTLNTVLIDEQFWLNGLHKMLENVELKHKDNACFMVGEHTHRTLRAFRNKDGQDIFEILLCGRTRLMGYPLFLVSGLPMPTKGNHPIAFGDFSSDDLEAVVLGRIK